MGAQHHATISCHQQKSQQTPVQQQDARTKHATHAKLRGGQLMEHIVLAWRLPCANQRLQRESMHNKPWLDSI